MNILPGMDLRHILIYDVRLMEFGAIFPSGRLPPLPPPTLFDPRKTRNRGDEVKVVRPFGDSKAKREAR